MPIHVNSIGSHIFFDLTGTIDLRQQEMEDLEWGGVDGTGFRLNGARGKPFQLRSIAYYNDWADYHTQFLAYAAESANNPINLIRNDESYGTFKVKRVVEAVPPQAVINVAGAPGKQVRGEFVWILQG